MADISLEEKKITFRGFFISAILFPDHAGLESFSAAQPPGLHFHAVGIYVFGLRGRRFFRRIQHFRVYGCGGRSYKVRSLKREFKK